MPELPDVTVYVEALERFVVGSTLRAVRLLNPFVLRSVEPPLEALVGRAVVSVERIGKRIVLGVDGELYLVVHLMIAGRLRWRKPTARVGRKAALLVIEFDHGLLLLTEAGSKRRASVHVVEGRDGLALHDPGGYEVLAGDREGFTEAVQRENRTLKRAMTDPRILSGIGNAYSDEILHRARLSPFRQTRQLDDDELERLHRATLEVLVHWIDRFRREVGESFPERVTAFREEMAVHGRYRQPCPQCGSPVQRIVYAESEANYCATCQTGGRLLADRSLSRLLKKDWPKTVEELEQRRR